MTTEIDPRPIGPEGDVDGSARRMAIAARVLLHAHPYMALFSIAGYVLTRSGLARNQPDLATTLVAGLFAIGGLSFLAAKPIVSSWCDRRSRAFALAVGTSVMAAASIACAVVLLMLHLGIVGGGVALAIFAALQVPIGAMLALVDGPDRDLLPAAYGIGPHSPTDVARDLRSTDWWLRASGIAAASFIGALSLSIMVMVLGQGAAAGIGPVDPFVPSGPLLLGAVLAYVLTAVGQLSAARLVLALGRRLPALASPPESRDDREDRVGFRKALAHIADHPRLGTLVPMTAIVDGWLIFLGSVLSVSALRTVVEEVPLPWSLGVGLLTALVIGALTGSQLLGNAVERAVRRRWASLDEDQRQQRQTSAALSVVALGVVALTAFLLVSSSTFLDAHPRFLLSLRALIYVIVLALRGFAQPLLNAQIDHEVGRLGTASVISIRGWASFGGRTVHVATAIVSILAATWLMQLSSGGDDVRSSVYRHTITIATTMAVVLVLGFLATTRFRALVARVMATGARSARFLTDRWFEYGLFLALLLLANSIGGHRLELTKLTASWGAIAYAACFLVVDASIEGRGRREGRGYLVLGLLVNSLAAIVIFAFASESTFGRETTSVFLASTCSFLVAVTIEVEVFSSLRRFTRRDALWARVFISSFVAQAIDTFIFVGMQLTFDGKSLLSSEAVKYVHGQMLVKWATVAALFWVVRVLVQARRAANSRRARRSTAERPRR